MCRLLVFKGADPIQLCHLVTRPAHSIINQAFDSRLRLDATRAVNGDGFGVGWYDSTPDPELGAAPCIFTSVTPAWNNQNLQRIADKIKSPLVFAHVRASTAGALSETNCHPWRYGRLMWMHNGQISDFARIKRRVLASLPEPLFLFPQGHTDSEFAFAVFLSHLADPLQTQPFSHRQLQSAMLATIRDFNAWSREAGITQPSLMNFCVTDGESVICTRYVSSKTDQAASLYFSSGTSFYQHAPGAYRMVKTDKREKMIVVASEPLTFEKADWMEIPTNTLVAITKKMNVLQLPIVDEFHLDKADATVRSPTFAIKTGFPPSMSGATANATPTANTAANISAATTATMSAPTIATAAAVTAASTTASASASAAATEAAATARQEASTRVLRSGHGAVSRPPARQRPLHVVLASTGSVASVKIPLMVERLLAHANVRVQVIATDASVHFYDPHALDHLNGPEAKAGYDVTSLAAENRCAEKPGQWGVGGLPRVHVWRNADEWAGFGRVGDSILHIELRRWADVVVVAPCSANTLARLAAGMGDDLLTCFLRALPSEVPVWLFPAMNTLMWQHALTHRHLETVKDTLGYEVHGPVEKTLACGDTGTGAMVQWESIVSMIVERFALQLQTPSPAQ